MKDPMRKRRYASSYYSSLFWMIFFLLLSLALFFAVAFSIFRIFGAKLLRLLPGPLGDAATVHVLLRYLLHASLLQGHRHATGVEIEVAAGVLGVAAGVAHLWSRVYLGYHTVAQGVKIIYRTRDLEGKKAMSTQENFKPTRFNFKAEENFLISKSLLQFSQDVLVDEFYSAFAWIGDKQCPLARDGCFEAEIMSGFESRVLAKQAISL